jgi:hypothetical protein
LVTVPLVVLEMESLRLKAAGSICMAAVLARARRRPKGGNVGTYAFMKKDPRV